MSMAGLPIQLIAMATASIIYHKLIQIADKTPELLFRTTVKILLGYAVLGLVPYLLIYLFGSELFGFIFGHDWTQSGTIASFLALPLFIGFLVMPISSIFRVTKTIKLQFIINFVLIIPIIIIFYLVSLSIPFYDSVYILAVGMSLHGLAIIVSALYVTWKSTQTALKYKKKII
jgi:O-antigen/teichoic acid export membrane protein